MGDEDAAERAREKLSELDPEAPPPPPPAADALARQRTLWLRRLAAREDDKGVVNALKTFERADAATPPMLETVRHCAERRPAPLR